VSGITGIRALSDYRDSGSVVSDPPLPIFYPTKPRCGVSHRDHGCRSTPTLSDSLTWWSMPWAAALASAGVWVRAPWLSDPNLMNLGAPGWMATRRRPFRRDWSLAAYPASWRNPQPEWSLVSTWTVRWRSAEMAWSSTYHGWRVQVRGQCLGTPVSGYALVTKDW